jgi:hypothetical protein
MGNCPMPCPQFDEPDPDPEPPVAQSQMSREMHILATSPPPSFCIVQVPQHANASPDCQPEEHQPPVAPVSVEAAKPQKPDDDTESVDSWDESTTVEVSHDEARLQGDNLQPDE